MTKQAFDQKNGNDFDENTRLIKDAIVKIKSRSSLSATVQQMVRLTGMHRNTFRSDGPRNYVHKELEEIKDRRNIEITINHKNKKNLVEELKEQLCNACNEVVLWFSKFDELERNFNQLQRLFKEEQSTKNWYIKELEKERVKLKKLQEQINTTNELLRDIQ